MRKLRLNETFQLIALYFGVSTSFASEAFSSFLPSISDCLRQLVFNIPKRVTLRNLPIAFRKNYYNVTHTLDAFEIQIQTPSHAKQRAATYSLYKGCNTLKYVISVTPDVSCNFVLRGYGGRASDTGIVNDCGLLDHFAPDSAVLADRGFKALESSLNLMGVTLQRPPSVFAGKALSKGECKKRRQVAAVRIHVERYIGRLRNFAFIAPHATVPVKLIPYVDFCVNIACGLTNLGSPLIKRNEVI
jgi:DDE superfamily endonuclease